MRVGFLVCFGVVTQVAWLKSLIVETCVVDSIAKSIQLYYVNINKVLISKNKKFKKKRFKHMEIKYLIVKELVNKGYIIVEPLRIDDVIVDPLTKGDFTIPLIRNMFLAWV